MIRFWCKMLNLFTRRGPKQSKAMHISLFEIPNDPNNAVVLRELEQLPGVSVTEVKCPPLDPPMFVMPYIHIDSDQSERPYFGVDGIRYFIKRTRRSYQRA
jgi:hypothetical protein